jgi:hypothetical protein
MSKLEMEPLLDDHDYALIEAAWSKYKTAICDRGRNSCNHHDARMCCGGGCDGNCTCVICHSQRNIQDTTEYTK